jgi:FMN-dependent NADH-azoreductase
MKTLVINAHPFSTSNLSTTSYTVNALNYFIETHKKEFGEDSITVVDLYNSEIPKVDEEFFNAIGKLMSGQEVSHDEQIMLDKRSDLLKQFKEHKKIVIGYPVYNLNITSKLKDYIDNIVVAKETFEYTERGPEGLLHNEGRKLLIIQSSGGHSEGGPTDMGNLYLTTIFGFIGITDSKTIRLEETNMNTLTREQILTKAYKEVELAIKEYK